MDATSLPRVGIPNNATVSIGPVRLGDMLLDYGPPVNARIAVMGRGDSSVYDVGLGDTFPADGGTWRFADVTGRDETGERFVVVVERVDAAVPAVLRPFGQVDEADLQALEQDLGRPLPPAYRRWLATTNGAQPAGEYHVPGLLFALFEERPLLGNHPQYPLYDLRAVDRLHRQGWLSTDYVVIAVPNGGLLAVRCTGPTADAVVLLPESAMTGQLGDAANAAREPHLVWLAPDIEAFLRLLRPIDLGSPATD
jgi:hypothetical protein